MSSQTRYAKQVEEQLEQFKTKIVRDFDVSDDLKHFLHSFTLDVHNTCKQKRAKNIIPLENRCEARKSNNERCTRRKKDGTSYCGTHIKGTPHGRISDATIIMKKVQYVTIEINGIIYFIDKENNIYNHEDIYNNIVNPRIIAKYDNEKLVFI